MAKSVAEGFEGFLDFLKPLESEREAAASHRASVESSLKNALSVSLFRQTGSFWHGTGIYKHCDVDLLVSIEGGRPRSSDTALKWVKDALSTTFSRTPVRVSRPAVVVDFAAGKQRWEVIPGFITGRGAADVYIYDIPAPGGDWMDTAPIEHIKYVNNVNSTGGKIGGAKKLARLMKAWKYYNHVPISSFYLEMRAAKYMEKEQSFAAVYDVCRLLENLDDIGLASMYDPSDATGRFDPCSSVLKRTEALSKVHTAATRARKALNAYSDDNLDEAFEWLDKLFAGWFPSP